MSDELTLVLTPEDNSILINEAVLVALNRPQHIQLMINEEKMMLLVRACTIEDREALVVPITTQNEYEVSGRSLIKRVRKATGWTDKKPRKVSGVIVPNFAAVVFALSTIKEIVL